MYYSSSAVHIDTYIDLQDDCPIHVVTNSEGAEITVGGRRDNTFELRVKSVLEGELSLEPELERWYAVWDAPVRGGGV